MLDCLQVVVCDVIPNVLPFRLWSSTVLDGEIVKKLQKAIMLQVMEVLFYINALHLQDLVDKACGRLEAQLLEALPLLACERLERQIVKLAISLLLVIEQRGIYSQFDGVVTPMKEGLGLDILQHVASTVPVSLALLFQSLASRDR